MRTQVMHGPMLGAPWLERDPADGNPVLKTSLATLPFTIGRNETADLPIDSSRVSREHCTIHRTSAGYRVEDLGSTNGTFLNGKRVEDAPLSDGDMLVVADLEFFFFSGKSQPGRNTATQIIGGGQSSCDDECLQIVRGVRRLHEMLAHRTVETLFQPLVELESGQVFGYEAIHAGEEAGEESRLLPAACQRLLAENECRVVSRLHQLQHLVAVEEALGLPRGVRVCLNLAPSEIGQDWLADSLVKLRDCLGDERHLIVEVPDSSVCDIPFFRDFHSTLTRMGIGLAYDGFAGGQSRVLEQKGIAPNFLKLSRALVRDVDHHAERQRQMQAVVRAASDLGCQAVATGVRTKAEALTCRDLGCRLAQGEWHSRALPLYVLLQSASA